MPHWAVDGHHAQTGTSSGVGFLYSLMGVRLHLDGTMGITWIFPHNILLIVSDLHRLTATLAGALAWVLLINFLVINFIDPALAGVCSKNLGMSSCHAGSCF